MRTLVLFILLALFATACGHKAALYLPDPSSAQQQNKKN